MDKRFWVCGVVMFFAAMLLAFVVHAFLLGPDYEALGAMYRDAGDGARYFPWILLAHALIGFAMTWIFAQGVSDDRPTLVQGLRFGLAMALFATIPGILIHYATQPLPSALVVKQIVFGTLSMLALGALLAWLQPRRPALTVPE